MENKEDRQHLAIGVDKELVMADGTKKLVHLEPLAMGHAYKYIPLCMRFAGADASKVQEIMGEEKVVKTISELIEVMLKQAGIENTEKVGMLNYMELMNSLFELNPLGVSKDMSAIKELKDRVRKNTVDTKQAQSS